MRLPTRRTLALTTSVLTLSTLASAQTTGRPLKGIEIADLDRKVDACTDFYDFANGTWRTENPIPAGMSRWSRRIAAQTSTKARVKSILEDVSRKQDWPVGSIERLLSDHYGSCMDETAVNAAGLTPVAPLLAGIDGAKSRADIQRSIRRLHDINVPVPFGVVGAMDYHAPKNFIANVTAGGLGLADRDDYLNLAPASVNIRARYVEHVANVLALGGTPTAQARSAADDIVALETRLAEASLPSASAGDSVATDHKMTFAQLKQLTPHIDWDAYFAEGELPRLDVNVAEPKFMQQLDKEFEQASLATWKAYLKWRLLDSASPFLPQAFVLASFNFKDKLIAGATKLKPRADRCAESTEALFGDAVGKVYVERYFPPAAKAKAEEMGRSLLAILQDDVAHVEWMTPGTKKKALAKLATVKVMAGYPEVWNDYSKVTVRRDTLWANVAAVRRFSTNADRQRIGRPTNREVWLLPPSASGAYIDLQLNALVLPAGFLQPPFFNIDANDAVNYGALGINLAHDLTHAIDALGAETDIDGRPENWWTAADHTAFDTQSQCVVDQYESYFIEPGVHHDGKRVRGEAVGDLTGVRLAYLALQKSMAAHPIPVIDGFTPEQQFFVSWGQTTGAAMSIETQRAWVAADPHAVPKFRVIGPFSTSPEFAKAFSCKAGAEMVRPAEKRCRVW